MIDREKIAESYIEHGFSLCATREGNNKEAYGLNWQKQGRPAVHWGLNPGDGMGIIHGLSGTCSIDIDDLENARIALEAVGIDLDALLSDKSNVQIDSGRENRAKLIFKLPDGIEPRRHALNWPDPSDSTKRIGIIEFRAGAGHDVLPPSVHPDTGEPYKWIGDWRNIPTLPDELAKVWREWQLAKEAMLDACPWHEHIETRIPRNVTTKTYAINPQHNDVIGAFNRAHSVDAILQANGYRRGGRRWLAPGSTTGIPGVVMLPDHDKTGRELVYSHHASCKLADGHAHDAFSLYCQLEHNGNVSAAVAEAGKDLGIARKPDPEAQAMVDRILKNQSSGNAVINLADHIEPKVAPEPEKITAPHPGPIPCPLLAKTYDYLCDHMHSVKPDAIMQAVLSFATAMTSRRYVTYDGQPTTTFYAITDSSIAGLRRIKGKLSALTNDVGERYILRDRAPTGAGPFYQALNRSPRMYWITDEYGYLVRTARRQTSGAMESALSVLQLCYDGETIFVDPDVMSRPGKAVKDMNDCNLYAPSVTMLALLPNDHLNSLVSHAEYGRGTLHQMLTIPAGETLDDHRPDNSAELPTGLIDHIKRLADMPGIAGTQNNATMQPMVKTVHWAPDVAALVSDKLKDWRGYMSDDSRQQYRGFTYGYMQSAIRLGSSLAAWVNPEEPRLTKDIARWAMLWAERCLKLTMPRLEIINRADDSNPDVMQLVIETLMTADGELSERDIRRRCYAFQKLSPDERTTLINNLVEAGTIIATKTSQTTKYLPARK